MATGSATTPSSYLTWFEALNTPAQPWVTVLVVPVPELLVQVPRIVKSAAAARNMQTLTLALRDKSLNEIKEVLENSFLGSYFLYCIWDVEQIPKNVWGVLTTYLLHYTGPHYIVLLCSSENILSSAWQKRIVSLPAAVTSQQFARFCTSWYPQLSQLSPGASLYLHNNQVMLNQFAVALPYLPILGKSLVPAFKAWYMPRLMKPDGGSLFTFADLFWQKNGPLFYKQWVILRELYAEQFWITFWSEQLFRAALYTYCMRAHDAQRAQQLAARKLSFVYTKKSWHRVDVALIRKLHAMLYTIDYSSKNGGSAAMIDHLYAIWFAG